MGRLTERGPERPVWPLFVADALAHLEVLCRALEPLLEASCKAMRMASL
ncbi:hypothetical protein EV12_0273 [Prochlorococcus sp. MIT 0701]|nr:hypothetical protein EV12_0273 [Prochlorococcus sp. MIT 0701]